MRKTMSRTGRRQALLGATLAATLATALAAGLPARAQTGTPAPGASADNTRPDPICASHGPGFARVAGTSTCVKITGGVQSDAYATGISGSARVDPLASALRSK